MVDNIVVKLKTNINTNNEFERSKCSNLRCSDFFLFQLTEKETIRYYGEIMDLLDEQFKELGIVLEKAYNKYQGKHFILLQDIYKKL